MKIDFHKEIMIPQSFYGVILPSIFSYVIVILAYYGGEDGLSILISWIDPFIFIFVPVLQKRSIKGKDIGSERMKLLLYFCSQIAFGIIVLIETFDGEPHWVCLELYMRWLFWASINNIISGAICWKVICS